jgi:hypothetical protein
MQQLMNGIKLFSIESIQLNLSIDLIFDDFHCSYVEKDWAAQQPQIRITKPFVGL